MKPPGNSVNWSAKLWMTNVKLNMAASLFGTRFRNPGGLIFVSLLFSGALSCLGANSATQPSEPGFISIFDGKTLTGWEPPTLKYWTVENGAIVGRITPETPCVTNQYLVWTGGELADFELKMRSRLTGATNIGAINNGFQFRSRLLPDHDVCGYQMDNNLDTPWLVRLYDEFGRHTLAMRGERSVFDRTGQRTASPIPESAGPAWFKLEDWHEYHLICNGPKITLKVDGKLAAETLDLDAHRAEPQGIFALQLHSGPPTQAEFKDIRIKILKPASPPSSPPPVTDALRRLKEKAVAWWELDTGGKAATPKIQHVPGWDRFQLNVKPHGEGASPNRSIIVMEGAHFESPSVFPSGTEQFTIHLRARAAEGRFGGVLMSQGSNSFQSAIRWHVAEAPGQPAPVFELEVQTTRGRGRTSFTTSALNPEAWHDFVARYDGKTLSLHCDGRLMSEREWSGVLTNDASLLLLCSEWVEGKAARKFHGELESAALWNHALSQDELLTLAKAAEPTPIGSRRELFVDRTLVDHLDRTELVLHTPQPAGVALELNQPWEGIVSGYVTVLKDGGHFLMYYRGRPTTSRGDGSKEAQEVSCVAESNDGIHWSRPKLRLHEVAGTLDNNVFMTEPKNVTHNFCPFLDTRPGVPPAERFKGVGGTGADGLFGYTSPDGIHWTPVSNRPLITQGQFDSQNVVFWSEHEQRYLCYFRTWKNDVRWVARSTSTDFRQWTPPQDMDFGDAPPEHIYIQQTQPYFRAPHIYLGIAARFNPGRRALTDEQVRTLDLENPRNYAELRNDDSDAVLLSSRGGTRYERTFLESFIRPGLDPRNWVARANYPALGIHPTSDTEMSIYIVRHYGQPSIHVERLTLRLDGVASIRAPYSGGEFLTKPITFEGSQLELNFSAGAAGQIQTEIQDLTGRPIPGYSLKDSIPMIGDDVARRATWKTGTELGQLRGNPGRIRFVMKDADLYALKFQ